MDKNIRLSKIIHNEDTVNNLIKLYKSLKGKENLEKRLFLKTLVWCSLNPNNKRGAERWVKPEEYFSPISSRNCFLFNEAKLNGLWGGYLFASYDKIFYLYNNNIYEIFGSLI